MRIILWVVTAAAVLAGSFFGTLWFLDQFFPGLGYDVGGSFPRVVRGQTLTFRNNENRGALISGWSGEEPWGVWSDGYEAQLGFVVSGISGENARIFIECNAFNRPKGPKQKVEFWSRNTRLGEETLREPSSNSFSIPLSGLKLGEGYPLVLRLKMPFAISPQELHESDADQRKLAVGLVSIRFDN
jgi:hypothetical protein